MKGSRNIVRTLEEFIICPLQYMILQNFVIIGGYTLAGVTSIRVNRGMTPTRM